MDSIIALLYFLSNNRFVFLMVAVMLMLLMRFAAKLKGLSNLKKKVLTKGSSLLLLVTLLIFIFGSEFANKLIYDHGQFGEGIVIEKNETGDMYNQEPVYRYETLIKTIKGETVQTIFDSDDFNLYPDSDNASRYPDVGLPFTVKHLEENPRVFIIITDDKSSYVTDLRCSELLKKLKAAKSKLEFSPNDEAFKNQYQKYNKAYLSGECAKNDNKYRADLSLDGKEEVEKNLTLLNDDFAEDFLLEKATAIKRPWFQTKWNPPKNSQSGFISRELVGHLLPKIVLDKESVLTCKKELFHFAKLSEVDIDTIGNGFYKPEHWASKFNTPIYSYKFDGSFSLLLVKEDKSQVVEIDAIEGDRFFTFHPHSDVVGQLEHEHVPIIYKTQLLEHSDFITYLTPTALKTIDISKVVLNVESITYGDADYPGTLRIAQLDLNGNGEYDVIRIKDDLKDLVSSDEDEGEGFSGDYILVYLENDWYLSSYRGPGLDGLEGY